MRIDENFIIKCCRQLKEMVGMEYVRLLETREIRAIFYSGCCILERMLRFKVGDDIHTIFQPIQKAKSLQRCGIDGTVMANWIPLLDPEKYPDCIPALFAFKNNLTRKQVVTPTSRIPVIGILIKMPYREFFPEACVWRMRDFNLLQKHELPQTGVGAPMFRTLDDIKSEGSVESLSDDETGDDDVNEPFQEPTELPFDVGNGDAFDVFAFVQSWKD